MRRLLMACVIAAGALAMSPGTAGAETVQYDVAASADDCYATETWSAYNQDILYWPYTNGDRRAFMRWAVDVPADATITTATVKVKSNGEAGDGNASTVRLQLLDSDDCPDFTTNPHDSAVTSGYVDWSVDGTWTDGQWYSSPDVSSIVQEFIDRSGYASGNYLGLRGINQSGLWKRAYQIDHATADAPVLEVTYSVNQAPVADAGSDQTVTDTDDSGAETVTLDGSGSSDSDGAITSWVWKESGSQVATGETADVSLDVGDHTITLTVTDDDGEDDSDVVQVTVNDPPVADAGSDQNVTDSDDTGYETVTLDGSGSSDADGTVVDWVWTEGGRQVATGETADVSLDVGDHTITLTVTDDDGGTDADDVIVTVAAGGGSQVEYQVAASADDTYCTSSGNNYLVSTMYFPYNNSDRLAFLRWSIDVPADATVTAAYVKVKSNGNAGNSSDTDIRLQLVDEDDCPALSTNPYAWTVTSTTVDWTLPGEWLTDQWYVSSDVSSLVQEFIDRPGYVAGNYLGLRGAHASGMWKQAYQVDNASADGAVLEVHYTTP